MRFDLSVEQREFSRVLGDLLGAEDVVAISRAWARGDSSKGQRLRGRLAGLGVTALFVPEASGGLGGTPVDLAVVFEQLGRHVVPGPYIESVVVAPALLAAVHDSDLDQIAAGRRVVSLAAPPMTPYALDSDVADETLLLRGNVLARARTGTPHRSVDASRRLFSVEEDVRLGRVDPIDVAEAFNRGALACSAQLLGAGERLLAESVAYTSSRTQFGRPVGEFQALKHAMSDVKVALEFARPLVYGAALSLGEDSHQSDRDISAAKVAAGDAAYLAARTALQMHGAIGYTAEYHLSLWITKVRALVSAWGTPSWHRARVWEAIRLTATAAR
jgi:alkylation response protein AidB-like acyl-CoA dehydrogenase